MDSFFNFLSTADIVSYLSLIVLTFFGIIGLIVYKIESVTVFIQKIKHTNKQLDKSKKELNKEVLKKENEEKVSDELNSESTTELFHYVLKEENKRLFSSSLRISKNEDLFGFIKNMITHLENAKSSEKILILDFTKVEKINSFAIVNISAVVDYVVKNNVIELKLIFKKGNAETDKAVGIIKNLIENYIAQEYEFAITLLEEQ